MSKRCAVRPLGVIAAMPALLVVALLLGACGGTAGKPAVTLVTATPGSQQQPWG